MARGEEIVGAKAIAVRAHLGFLNSFKHFLLIEMPFSHEIYRDKSMPCL